MDLRHENFFVAAFVIESSLTHITTNMSGSLTEKKDFHSSFHRSNILVLKEYVFNKSADLE